MLAGQLPTWYLLSDNCRKKPWNNKGLFILSSWTFLKPSTLSTGGHFERSSKLMGVLSHLSIWSDSSMMAWQAVSIGGDISDAFPINHRVKQGCVLAPTLFTLYLGAVLETMSANLASGIYIWTCSDGKLFNLAHLKAETRTNRLCVRELLYADDMALVATDCNDIQEIVNQFHSAATMFGLKINTTKTELMYQPHPTNSLHLRNTDMLIYGEALRCTDSFIYLGGAVTNTVSSHLKIERHVQSASQSFGTL